MAYKFEFVDGAVRSWTLTDDGATTQRTAYTPTIYAAGPDAALAPLQGTLEADPKVVSTDWAEWRTSLHDRDPERVLQIELERTSEVFTLAHEIRGVHERGGDGRGRNGGRGRGDDRRHPPGTIRLFDVDLDPGVRYCLDRDIDPTPSRPPTTLELGIGERALAARDCSTLRIDGEDVSADPADVLWSLQRRLEREDPDVLVLSSGDLVPVLFEVADAEGLDGFRLGREEGWTRLAGANTYASYGQVGHSPARYDVPGRAIVDRSNSFLWHQSGLDGILYLVGRSRRPLQACAWGSIGTILTSMQIRVARERGVLAPWNKWEPEAFKDLRTLHAADRGGFTFAPEVGCHEDVHEIDFASLYPRIICEFGISPETVNCDCHDGDDVPELEYSICPDRDPFLPEVLAPLLSHRKSVKDRLREAGEPGEVDGPGGDGDGASTALREDEAARLRAESGAIKWILVSCFGYQGYRNAKFGRIECHEAINACARDIALRAKHHLEANGWRIVHGIVDSLWVTPAVADPTPLEDVRRAITREVGIHLDHDGAYEWVCFVPRRGREKRASAGASARRGEAGRTPPGALTKYFGKRTDGSYKYRGVECRQHSTPAFVAECQREFVAVLDRERDPAAVCDRLARRLGDLRLGGRRPSVEGGDATGPVEPADLVITRRASKPLAAYRQSTHTAAALARYERHGIDRHPGQPVRYVVVDDDARGPERVRLAFEAVETYDADYYARLLVRAAESVTSPLGWNRELIRRYLEDGRTPSLSTFVDAE